MAEIVQTLRAYEPFDQILSEVETTLAHVRGVSSEIEDLNQKAKHLRDVLPPSNEAPENSSRSKRDAIAVVVEGLNQHLDGFHKKLREYHGEEVEASKDALWERTFLKRKLATCIQEDAAHIKYDIDSRIKTIERMEAIPTQ